jgi:hypothetical protein
MSHGQDKRHIEPPEKSLSLFRKGRGDRGDVAQYSSKGSESYGPGSKKMTRPVPASRSPAKA